MSRRSIRVPLIAACVVALAGPATALPALAAGAPSAAPLVVRPAAVPGASVVLTTPRPSVTLPAKLDVQPRYQPATACDPTDRTGTVRLGRLLTATYGAGVVGFSRNCDGTLSEHHDGRAIDWMLNAADPTQRAVADSFRTWVTADGGAVARRLGIQYLIWNKQMWRAYAPERGWAPYSGASPHTDHIHISLTWDGAMGRTSWWTGQARTDSDVGPCRVYAGTPAPLYSGRRTAPCPIALPVPPASALPLTLLGSRDKATVALGQTALGITADGVFGRGTQQAILAYQRRQGLPTSGAFDKPTWNRLAPTAGPASVTPPAAGPTPQTTAPRPPAATAPRTTAPRAGVTVPATIVRPLEAFKKTVLRPTSQGAAVRSLQSALRVRVTGRMDAPTRAAVARVQKQWKLPATGVVDLRTWNRVELTRWPHLGYTGTVMRSGSTGPGVVAVQKALAVTADGQFGPRTATAVRTIQNRYGLPATGVVDAATWRAISHAVR